MERETDNMPLLNLLVLGGTTEARQMATEIVRTLPKTILTLSLAGTTTNPAPYPGKIRYGGFGGALGLVEWLTANRIDAVLDATHPYAEKISANAADACSKIKIPLLQLVRSCWSRQPNDQWYEAANSHAAAAIPPVGARLFLTLGGRSITPFATRLDCYFLIRSIESIAPLFPDADMIYARGPFDLISECHLLRKHKIEWLICKNSGGSASYAKIVAARELKLPVILLTRPTHAPSINSLSSSMTVNNAPAALAWIRAYYNKKQQTPI